MKFTRIFYVSTAVAALAGAGLLMQANQTRGQGLIRVGPIPKATLAAATAEQAPLASAASSSSATPPGAGLGAPSPDDAKIALVTSRLLAQSHYSRKPLNDTISSKLLDQFLDALDPQHVYFLQSDVKEFEKWRTSLDDLLWKQGDTTPARAIFTRFLERFDTSVAFINEELKTPAKFTFTGSDSFVLDRKKLARPADLASAKGLWRDRLRYEFLQEKLNKKKPEEIVTTINRRYSRLARSLHEYDKDDVFELYLTTLSHVYDPHSDYFGKATSENFNIGMKLSLFGIGAQLQSEDGYTKIMELTPGGPAIKSKQLKPGDRIVAVAQGAAGEPVDVVDMKLNKVVEMIRGAKGTTVRLTVIPADAVDPSTRKTIVLVRDEVKLEEQAAKARLIEVPDASGKMVRLGVIDLPLFYTDSEGGKKSAAEDVGRLLARLEKEKVAGIILDLRRNGGGSLPEAIAVTGLFIKQGPVVQVRDPSGKVTVDDDEDATVAYNGPLVVLISRFSASASEIVAGALQDYNRALIVGDTTTFGKGTVQALIGLGPVMARAGVPASGDPGAMKLTTQKFYRASGSSTQLKGVASDIVIPAATSLLEVGEATMTDPLPWDTVSPANYAKTNHVTPQLRADLKKRSAARIASDADFRYFADQIKRLKANINQKAVSLNEATRRQEREEAETRAAARKKVLAARPKFNERIYALTLSDLDKPGLPEPLSAQEAASESTTVAPLTGGDSDDSETPKPAEKNPTPERDMTLDEARRILLDLANGAK